MSKKKAWETHEVGRAQKAKATRQRFLDSALVNVEDQPASDVAESTVDRLDVRTPDEATQPIAPPVTPAPKAKRSHSTASTKRGSRKEEAAKLVEPQPVPPPPPPPPVVFEPLLHVSPYVKPKKPATATRPSTIPQVLVIHFNSDRVRFSVSFQIENARRSSTDPR